MNWEQSRLFRFLRWVLRVVLRRRETVWSKPFDGEKAAIFVCNHDRAYGPIAMCAHFDLCEDVRPWINAEVLSARELPSYVRKDYWWPPDKWYTKILDYTLAYIYALILPPILRGSACIPIYHDTKVMSTLRSSVDALKNGKHIVLFPEHPTGYCQYSSDVFSGFVSLGRLLYRRAGQVVNFYPTFIDWKGREIRIGDPIPYDHEIDFDLQTENISAAVADHFRKNGAEAL